MVQASCYLLDRRQVFEVNGHLLEHELAADLLFSNHPCLVLGWYFLLNAVHVDLAVLPEHEHPVLGEGHLANLCSSKRLHQGHVRSVTVSNALHLNRAQLGLTAHPELRLLVNVCLVVPAECRVDNVWLVGALEVLDFLRREIAVVLGCVHLIPFAPDVDVGVELVDAGDVVLPK